MKFRSIVVVRLVMQRRFSFVDWLLKVPCHGGGVIQGWRDCKNDNEWFVSIKVVFCYYYLLQVLYAFDALFVVCYPV